MLKLEIVTPERKVVEIETDSVTVPTASGEAGILTNHAPLISALKPGILTYSGKGGAEKLAMSSGFVEVGSDQVSVLTDIAESADEVNAEQARADREEAERELAANSTDAADENDSIRERVDLANARLSLAAGR